MWARACSQDDALASMGYSRKVLTSVKYLRNCFRRGIIGDRRSDTFNMFWTAVARFAPDVEVTVDRPTSSRNTTELQPAFNLVRTWLRLGVVGSVSAQCPWCLSRPGAPPLCPVHS